jgi:hypothetical protein
MKLDQGGAGVCQQCLESAAASALAEWVRNELYGVRAGGRRALATTAVAAAAAEEAYRLMDPMGDWQNEASVLWRDHLRHVWAFLAGDSSQHYVLSRAIADFLVSPLNHNEGQDGPDDFDRPQTAASYSAALSAVTWGVDFAETAVMQVFDAIDLKYDGEYSEARWTEVQREIAFVRRAVNTLVRARDLDGPGLDAQLLASIKP